MRTVFAAASIVGIAGCSSSPEYQTGNPILPPSSSTTTTTTTTIVGPTTTLAPVELEGFDFGYAVSSSYLDDPRYLEILQQDASMLAVENAMKWDTIHPARGVYDFEEADRIVEFARDNGQTVRGHTLIWHNQLAEWVVEGNWDRDGLIEVMRSHIQRIVRHFAEKYPGVVTQWDVVNEAFRPDGTRRRSVWQRVIGDDYIELAFQFAREADPDAVLFYNDYFDDAILGFDDPAYTELGASASRANCDEVPKCAAVATMARRFVDGGVPLDGIGFEGHVFDAEPTDYGELSSWTVPLGLQWAFTEIDVALPRDGAGSPALLAEQTAAFESMVSSCADSVNCNTVVVWGVHDDQSWIPDASEGSLGDALLYDANLERKPVADAVQRIVDAARAAR